jgi:hypothetical protein
MEPFSSPQEDFLPVKDKFLAYSQERENEIIQFWVN